MTTMYSVLAAGPAPYRANVPEKTSRHLQQFACLGRILHHRIVTLDHWSQTTAKCRLFEPLEKLARQLQPTSDNDARCAAAVFDARWRQRPFFQEGETMRKFLITLTLLTALGTVTASSAQAAGARRNCTSRSHFGRMAFIHHQSPSTIHDLHR